MNPSWPIGAYVFPFLTGLSLVAAAVLARRNLARGRGDRRGALRLAVATGILMITRLAIATHSQNPIEEWWIANDILMLALFRGATVWLLYLAVEPYVRRRWPHMLISVNRLLAGRLRDPMIGRDLLIGGLAGAVALAISHSRTAIAFWSGAANAWPANPLSHPSMNAPLGFGWIAFLAPVMGILATMVALTTLVVFRLVFRSYVVAMLGLCVCLSLVFYSGAISATRIGTELAAFGVMLFVLHRYGALAFAVAYTYYEALTRACLTFDFGAWYSLRSTAVLVWLALLALWGFHTSLAGKPAFGRFALDEEPVA